MAIKQAPPEPDLPNIRRHLRARPLARLLGWGSAATVALTAVALTSQSEDGRQRLQMAIAYVSAPARAVAQLPPASLQAEANTRHLAAQLSELAADRERLTARIAVLERSLEDMTGSIKQQNERLPAAQAASSPPPAGAGRDHLSVFAAARHAGHRRSHARLADGRQTAGNSRSCNAAAH